jgi:hypothetical protein
VKYDEYGCENFYPIFVKGVDYDSEKLDLLQLYSSGVKDYGLLRLGLEKTYPLQRRDILSVIDNNRSFSELLELWPIFYNRRNLMIHFHFLMGFDIQKRFDAHFEQVCQYVVQFLGSDR